MHVSCPMVLVINPIASSFKRRRRRRGAGTSNDGAGGTDGNGNDRATVAMDDAGEAVAGDGGGCGDFVGRRSRDCGRHWQQQPAHRSTWNTMVACRSSSSPKWKLMANINPSHTSCSSNAQWDHKQFWNRISFNFMQLWFTQENFFYTWSCTYSSDFDTCNRVLKTISEKIWPQLLLHPKWLLPSLVLLAGFFACSCTITTAHCRYLLVEVNLATWKIQEPPIRLTIHTKSNSIE